MTQAQKIKLIQQGLGVTADGIWGPQTLAAMAAKLGVAIDTNGNRSTALRALQKAVGAAPDGILGPGTLTALAAALHVELPFEWPTQSEVRSGKSIFGSRGDETRLVSVVPAYQHYYAGTPMKHLRVNSAMADRCMEAWRQVLAHYGAARIRELGLDVFDGCFNNRATRNGSKASMHAFGAALDYDAAHNGNLVHAPKARFSGSDYKAWFGIWEGLGFVTGRMWDRDYMHIQAARMDD